MILPLSFIDHLWLCGLMSLDEADRLSYPLSQDCFATDLPRAIRDEVSTILCQESAIQAN